MKLWTLMENTACREDFAAEHGLSLYLETGARRILFDMGQSGAFAENARLLGIDLAAVDTAILSHGHYDHGGGIPEFFRRNEKAQLFVNRHAFEPHYNRKGRYIGLDPALRHSPRLVLTDDTHMLADGLSLHTCNGYPFPCPADPCGLQMEVSGSLQPEDFRHEQYLLIEEAGRRILISGCSHKGIVNLVHRFRPHVLVGGFHLKDTEPDSPEIGEIARKLLRFDTVYYTGHCTGEMQYDRLKAIMGERVQRIQSGSVIEI